jgi:WD40 repeat protein
LLSGHRLIYSGGVSSPTTALALNSNGTILLEALQDCTVRVLELPTGKELLVLSGHLMAINALAFSPDDRLVVSVSGDRTVRIWEIVTGTLIATFTCDSAVLSCAYMSNERIIAGDASGHVHFLRLEPAQRNA